VDRRRDRAAVAANYRERLAAHQARSAALDARHVALGNARLALAAAALALGVAAFGLARIPAWWLTLPIGAFAVLAVIHARLLDERTRARRAAAYVEAGLGRLEHRWQGHGASGLAYLRPDHLYAEDLDVFGAGGLFELVSTARTTIGESTLAGWLLAPSVPEVARARQDAARDLSGREQFREDLATLGPEVREGADSVALLGWARQAISPPPAWGPVLLVGLSAATLAGGALWVLGAEPTMPAWLPLAALAQGAVGLALRRRVLASIRELEPRARDLAVVAAALTRIEQEALTAPRLTALHARLTATGVPASREIQRLSRLVELLTSRRNQFFAPVAFVVFWATHLAWAIDRWRIRVGPCVPDWLEALGEIEALASLGGYTAEHPDHVFPEFVDGAARLQATGLAHPLLPADTAVPNDVSLGDEDPHLWLVSGSNMSGKSTWLRAVGLNAVLAQAGAPVCATRFVLTPLMPAGTLRVQDSLQAGRSRFFAEITKLRQIVESARQRQTGDPVTLFLIDELLAGTNSHDRRLGAEGVLRGLLDLGAIGLATTHDLALTELATSFGPRAANAHFADRFDGGGLEFDYRLRPGVVGTSNALALMRSVGLDV
jgi:hypothetical protein